MTIVMKICLVSDLHIDKNLDVEFDLVEWPEADVLVVAGDTANSVEIALPFINQMADYYPRVIVLDGNHEHWHTRALGISVEENLANLRAGLANNVDLLDETIPMIEIDGVQFVGANGWYTGDSVGDPDYNKAWWQQKYSDADFTDFSGNLPWQRAQDHASLVRSTIENSNSDKPVVVVTHTVPHRSLLRYDNPAWAFFNAFFCNMAMHDLLESEISSHISYWFYGHTHVRSDRAVNGVQMIANPFGRLQENPNWFPMVVEL